MTSLHHPLKKGADDESAPFFVALGQQENIRESPTSYLKATPQSLEKSACAY